MAVEHPHCSPRATGILTATLEVEGAEALGLSPELAAARYLRGAVRKRQDDAAGATADIEAAACEAPRIGDDYQRWGVTG